MSDPEPESRFAVTVADIRSYPWQDVLATASEKHTWNYVDVLGRASKECVDNGDDLGRRVYGLLQSVVSFHPNFDLKTNPFEPMFTYPNGQHSLMAEELEDSDLQALRELLPDIQDPTFRARVGDVVWECKKDHTAARLAVAAYVEQAKNDPDVAFGSSRHGAIERAAQLSAKLGFGKPLHNEVIILIEEWVTQVSADLPPENRLVAHQFMLILLGYSDVAPTKYAAIAESLAKTCADLKDFTAGHDYWDAAAHWWRKTKKQDEAERCQREGAECLISAAEEIIKAGKPGFGGAAHTMERGLQELRQARGTPERVDAVMRRFLEIQERSLEDSNSLSVNLKEIPGFEDSMEKVQKAAIARVHGLPIDRAIARLAFIAHPTDVAELKKEVEDLAEKAPLQAIMGAVAVGSKGQTLGRIPPALKAGQPDETGLEQRLFNHAKTFSWKMRVIWMLEPARQAIANEHAIRLRDLFILVENNPFVPPGHEGIYLRGFQSGFFGDWLTAMSLLLPQVEASLRYLLHQRKIPTASLNSEGIQEERDITQLLKMAEIEEILGPDTLFDLRGILIDRFGHNMRNEAAHGLMPEGLFYQPASVYLWWLLLRTCYLGYRLRMDYEKKTNPAP